MTPQFKFFLGKAAVGVGVLAAIVIYGYVESADQAKLADDKWAERKIAEATEILSMWDRGVTADSAPSYSPEAAKSLLQNVLKLSGVRADIHVRASDVIARIDASPYYRLCGNVASFRTLLDDLQSWNVPTGSHIFALPESMIDGVVVIDMRNEPDSDGATCFLSGDLNTACGPKLTTTADQIKQLILVRMTKQKIGEYEIAGLQVDSGKEVTIVEVPAEKRGAVGQRVAAYRHLCDVYFLDPATKQVLTRRKHGRSSVDNRTISNWLSRSSPAARRM
jgi:hypothetical protein